MSCSISYNNLPLYLQGVLITPSENVKNDYLSTATVPSSVSFHRVWQLVARGTVTGTTGSLYLDYSEAQRQCPIYSISFTGLLQGTWIVNNQVYGATKYVSYEQTHPTTLLLRLTVPKQVRECSRSDLFSYQFDIFIDDAAIQSLTYGTDSSGTNYVYHAATDVPGYNELVLQQGNQAFAWTNLQNEDIIQASFQYNNNTGSSDSYLYINTNNSGYYVSDMSGNQTGDGLNVAYLSSTNTNNWVLYWDYTNTLNTPGGTFQFLGKKQYTIISISPQTSGSIFEYNLSHGTQLYMWIGNVKKNDALKITQSNFIDSNFILYLYNNGNSGFSPITQTSSTIAVKYTGTQWTTTQ